MIEEDIITMSFHLFFYLQVPKLHQEIQSPPLFCETMIMMSPESGSPQALRSLGIGLVTTVALYSKGRGLFRKMKKS
jgi:hypothetical protein